MAIQPTNTERAMSFIDRMKARMTGSLGAGAFLLPDKDAPRQRTTIDSNRWDERVWGEARKGRVVDDMIEDLTNGDQAQGGDRPGFEMAPELVHDVFMSLYKANPRLRGKREVEKESVPVRKIMKEILKNPKLAELQDITATDAMMSAVAVDGMSEALRTMLTRLPPPPPQPPGPGGEGGGGGEPGGGGGQAGGDSGGPGEAGNPNDKQGADGPKPGDGLDGDGDGDGGDAEDDLKEQQGEGQDDERDLNAEGGEDMDKDQGEEDADQDDDWSDWEDEFESLMDEADFERLANKALDAALNEAEELDEARKGIGLGDGEWKSMSPEARLAMARKLQTPEMKALADIIGRMKRFALGVKATRVVDVPHEIFDVHTGNDIRHILKGQYALLGHEGSKWEFYRRYLDAELLQYKLHGKEEVGKGPIVIAIDKSGSMQGQPFMWAMAVAEALRRFAADEDRDYYAMFFGNNRDRNRFEFPKGKGPFEKVLAFLSCIANGGTQFDGVLTEALERASRSFDKDGTPRADIIFVTDGASYLTDEWIESFNKERERVGVRVFSVFIGGAYDMSYQGGPLDLLKKISDTVIPVSELKPEAAADIFAKV